MRATLDRGPAGAESGLDVQRAGDAPELALALSGPAPHQLVLDVAPNTDGPRRVAVVADGSYRAFKSEFEATDVTQVLIGRGLELVRLEFDAPVSVRSSLDGAGTRVEVALGNATRARAQLAFSSERDAAVTLASTADMAQKAGRLGDAYAAWKELLANYGFEDDLVDRAERELGVITTKGREALSEVEADVERAGFFGLPGIYDDCERRAVVVRDRFAPTDDGGTNPIHSTATELLARIRSERAALDVGGEDVGPDPAEAIRSYLERTGLDDLANRIQRQG
ncbi:MAG: hypothetical protein R3F34_08015 [Planctomycetota bacterium]